MARSANGVTRQLNQLVGGKQSEREEESLLIQLYPQLHKRAEYQLKRRRRGHTLQATAVLHDAWMRLRKPSSAVFKNRMEFLRRASQKMRDVLARYDRGKRAIRRGGERQILPLSDAGDSASENLSQLLRENELDIMSMINRLRLSDPERAELAEAIMVCSESCEAYAARAGISPKTAREGIRATRAQFCAWLQLEDPCVS